MIWVRRTFAREGWYHVQDRFEEQFGARGDPKDMMLLFADRPDYQTDIFVGLPDESLLSNYQGIQPIAECNLPRRVRLL